MNAYYAVYLYALATANVDLTHFSHLLLSMEVQATQFYWHMPNDDIYDSVFAASRMAGNIGALDVTASTWFGSELEYVHGINLYVQSPQSHDHECFPFFSSMSSSIINFTCTDTSAVFNLPALIHFIHLYACLLMSFIGKIHSSHLHFGNQLISLPSHTIHPSTPTPLNHLNIVPVHVVSSCHSMPVTPATALLFDQQFVMIQYPILAARLPPPALSTSKLCAANHGNVSRFGYSNQFHHAMLSDPTHLPQHGLPSFLR